MYKIFKTTFFLSILFGILLMVFYIKNIMSLSTLEMPVPDDSGMVNPFSIFSQIFTPTILILYILTLICNLTYMIIGIIFIVRKEPMNGTEKAFWIIGFLMLGFITAIVFMVLNKSKGLTGGKTAEGVIQSY